MVICSEALEKIQEVPFDSSSDGWILFNVTEALYKWVHDQDANLGLVISVFRTKTGTVYYYYNNKKNVIIFMCR
jgi:TGF-beta propeptide